MQPASDDGDCSVEGPQYAERGNVKSKRKSLVGLTGIVGKQKASFENTLKDAKPSFVSKMLGQSARSTQPHNSVLGNLPAEVQHRASTLSGSVTGHLQTAPSFDANSLSGHSASSANPPSTPSLFNLDPVKHAGSGAACSPSPPAQLLRAASGAGNDVDERSLPAASPGSASKTPGSGGKNILSRSFGTLKRVFTPKGKDGRRNSMACSEVANISPGGAPPSPPRSNPSSTSLDLNARTDQAPKSPRVSLSQEVYSAQDDQDWTAPSTRSREGSTEVQSALKTRPSAQPPSAESLEPVPIALSPFEPYAPDASTTESAAALTPVPRAQNAPPASEDSFMDAVASNGSSSPVADACTTGPQPMRLGIADVAMDTGIAAGPLSPSSPPFVSSMQPAIIGLTPVVRKYNPADAVALRAFGQESPVTALPTDRIATELPPPQCETLLRSADPALLVPTDDSHLAPTASCGTETDCPAVEAPEAVHFAAPEACLTAHHAPAVKRTPEQPSGPEGEPAAEQQHSTVDQNAHAPGATADASCPSMDIDMMDSDCCALEPAQLVVESILGLPPSSAEPAPEQLPALALEHAEVSAGATTAQASHAARANKALTEDMADTLGSLQLVNDGGLQQEDRIEAPVASSGSVPSLAEAPSAPSSALYPTLAADSMSSGDVSAEAAAAAPEATTVDPMDEDTVMQEDAAACSSAVTLDGTCIAITASGMPAGCLLNPAVAEPTPVTAELEAAASVLSPTAAEPAAADPEPAAADPEPAAADPQPAAADPEPAAADPEPATAGPEPATADPEPAAADPEPAPAEPAPLAVLELSVTLQPAAPEPASAEPEPAAAEPEQPVTQPAASPEPAAAETEPQQPVIAPAASTEPAAAAAELQSAATALEQPLYQLPPTARQPAAALACSDGLAAPDNKSAECEQQLQQPPAEDMDMEMEDVSEPGPGVIANADAEDQGNAEPQPTALLEVQVQMPAEAVVGTMGPASPGKDCDIALQQSITAAETMPAAAQPELQQEEATMQPADEPCSPPSSQCQLLEAREQASEHIAAQQPDPEHGQTTGPGADTADETCALQGTHQADADSCAGVVARLASDELDPAILDLLQEDDPMDLDDDTTCAIAVSHSTACTEKPDTTAMQQPASPSLLPTVSYDGEMVLEITKNSTAAIAPGTMLMTVAANEQLPELQVMEAAEPEQPVAHDPTEAEAQLTEVQELPVAEAPELQVTEMLPAAEAPGLPAIEMLHQQPHLEAASPAAEEVQVEADEKHAANAPMPDHIGAITLLPLNTVVDLLAEPSQPQIHDAEALQPVMAVASEPKAQPEAHEAVAVQPHIEQAQALPTEVPLMDAHVLPPRPAEQAEPQPAYVQEPQAADEEMPQAGEVADAQATGALEPQPAAISEPQPAQVSDVRFAGESEVPLAQANEVANLSGAEVPESLPGSQLSEVPTSESTKMPELQPADTPVLQAVEVPEMQPAELLPAEVADEAPKVQTVAPPLSATDVSDPSVQYMAAQEGESMELDDMQVDQPPAAELCLGPVAGDVPWTVEAPAVQLAAAPSKPSEQASEAELPKEPDAVLEPENDNQAQLAQEPLMMMPQEVAEVRELAAEVHKQQADAGGLQLYEMDQPLLCMEAVAVSSPAEVAVQEAHAVKPEDSTQHVVEGQGLPSAPSVVDQLQAESQSGGEVLVDSSDPMMTSPMPMRRPTSPAAVVTVHDNLHLELPAGSTSETAALAAPAADAPASPELAHAGVRAFQLQDMDVDMEMDEFAMEMPAPDSLEALEAELGAFGEGLPIPLEVVPSPTGSASKPQPPSPFGMSSPPIVADAPGSQPRTVDKTVKCYRDSLQLFSMRESCQVSDSLQMQSLEGLEPFTGKPRVDVFGTLETLHEMDAEEPMAATAAGGSTFGGFNTGLLPPLDGPDSPVSTVPAAMFSMSPLQRRSSGDQEAGGTPTLFAPPPAAAAVTPAPATGGAAAAKVSRPSPVTAARSPGLQQGRPSAAANAPVTALKAMAASGPGSASKPSTQKKPSPAIPRVKPVATTGTLSKLPGVAAATSSLKPVAAPPALAGGSHGTGSRTPAQIAAGSRALRTTPSTVKPALPSADATPSPLLSRPVGTIPPACGAFDTPTVLRAAAMPLADSPFIDFDLTDTVDISAEANKALAMLGAGSGTPGLATQKAAGATPAPPVASMAQTPNGQLLHIQVQMLTDRIVEKDALLHEAGQEVESLKQQLQDMKQQLHEMEMLRKEEADLANFERDVRQGLELEMDTLKCQLGSLQAELRQAKTKHQQFDAQIHAVRAEMDTKAKELDHERASMRSLLEKNVQDVEAAKKEAGDALAQKAAAEAEAVAARAKCDEVVVQLKDMHETMGAQAHKLLRAERVSEEADAKVRTVMNQLIDAQTKYSEEAKKSAELEKKLLAKDELVAKAVDMQARYKASKQEFNARIQELTAALEREKIEKAEVMNMCSLLLSKAEASKTG